MILDQYVQHLRSTPIKANDNGYLLLNSRGKKLKEYAKGIKAVSSNAYHNTILRLLHTQMTKYLGIKQLPTSTEMRRHVATDID